MRKFFLLVVLLANLTPFAQDIPPFLKDSLDNYVQRALKDWQIPGAAVCVVKDGKVVVMKGYGVKELGTSNKVDEHTLFMIGSNTKAFTATGLAMLHAQDKLSLDDKVQKYLPGFKLYDPWVAKETDIRDLLSHRIGFETFQGDFIYFDSYLTSSQILQKLAKVKPMYSFRSQWGYTNSAFLVAGEVLHKVSGRTWAQFMTDSIFTPLEMKNSLALSSDIETATNKSLAHTVVDGHIKKIAYGKLDNMGPAGSMSSSISDLSHWVLAQLDSGKYKGRQVIPFEAITETRKPTSILGNGRTLFNKGHFLLYGLGWFLQEYNGRLVVQHTGGINGFVTSVTLLPEEKLGIIVFTNTDANRFYEALKWEIMDAYMNLPYRNYSNVYLSMHKQQLDEESKWLKAKKDTIAMKPKTMLPLQSFLGTYKNEIYGLMHLTMQNGKILATFEHHKTLHAELEAIGGNRFLATFNDPLYGIRVWPFSIEKGKIKSVTVTVADFIEFTPYEFYKIK
jgi:CubicO group peptidase (beta-lactamase class C family)